MISPAAIPLVSFQAPSFASLLSSQPTSRCLTFACLPRSFCRKLPKILGVRTKKVSLLLFARSGRLKGRAGWIRKKPKVPIIILGAAVMESWDGKFWEVQAISREGIMKPGDLLKTIKPIRSQKTGTLLPREGTFISAIENLGRRLILVDFGSAGKEYLFPEEIVAEWKRFGIKALQCCRKIGSPRRRQKNAKTQTNKALLESLRLDRGSLD
jgi:hypothetical protein